MIGTTVGKYRIVDKLGRGGMGTVYKAVDQTLDREVAIKVLNPDLTDADVLKRFRGEAVTLARLNHPGIATIYELHHQQDDELLMVMEFVRGETFHDLSDRLGPLAPPQAAHLCMQVLDALGHAHRGGVVHRDLKPANLMITDGGAVKVMDFGIARVLGTEHFTHGGYMMGTPAYMAPEQVLGREIDGRADLYSVGVVLYRLLSSRLPFNADTAISMVQMQISEVPTPIATFRPDLPGVVHHDYGSRARKVSVGSIPERRGIPRRVDRRGDTAGARRDAHAVDADAAGPFARYGRDGSARHSDPDAFVGGARIVGGQTRATVQRSGAAGCCGGPYADKHSAAREDHDRRARPEPSDGARRAPRDRRGWDRGPRVCGLSRCWIVHGIAGGGLGGAGDCGAGIGSGANGCDRGADECSAVGDAAGTVPPPAAAPATPVQKTPPPAGATVGQPLATGERGVATAGAGPAKGAGRGTTTGVSPGASPIDPARGGRAANAKDTVAPPDTAARAARASGGSGATRDLQSGPDARGRGREGARARRHLAARGWSGLDRGVGRQRADHVARRTARSAESSTRDPSSPSGATPAVRLWRARSTSVGWDS